MEKKITAIMCTYGRVRYVRRSIGLFLNQNYENKQLLIYNNAPEDIIMDSVEGVIIINNHIDLVTSEEYGDVGSIFRDALTFVDKDTNYIAIWDDDDIFFENHLSQGMIFLQENPDFMVWRNRYYLYKLAEQSIEMVDSVTYTEGACIIEREFLDKIGFHLGTSLTYHHKWYLEAQRLDKFGIEQNILPTFCLEWAQQSVAHISSLAGYNDANTRNLVKSNSTDFGNGSKLVPWKNEIVKQYLQDYFSSFFDNN